MAVGHGFESVVGHGNIKKILETSIKNGHVGHAYIFSGSKGVGKYTMARAFASALVGTYNSEHADIITVTNQWYGIESKSNSILVDTMKEMRRDVYIKPYSLERKVYIVPHADTMNVAAQNSILKVFEEPPSYCTIILLAENSSKFLQTILSRATEIRFSSLPSKIVQEYLVDKCGIPIDEAAAKAVMSDGSIGKALEVLENAVPDEIRTKVITYLVNLIVGENRVIFEFSAYLKAHKDDMDFIFSILKSFFDDLLHLKYEISTNLVNVDKMSELNNLVDNVTRRAAAQFLDITLKYERVVASNANFRIAMFCMVCEYWEEIHGRNYRSSI